MGIQQWFKKVSALVQFTAFKNIVEILLCHMQRIVKYLYKNEQKKRLVPIPDNDRTVVNQLARYTLVTGFSCLGYGRIYKFQT